MEKVNNVERLENKQERMKGVYTALFVVDIEAIKSQFPPKHPKVFAHHSTIEFQPLNLNDIDIGKRSTMKIVGRAYDEKGDALLVENPKSKNKYPHITLSCAEGTSPVYSNQLFEIADANGTIERFETPIEIEVVEGYSERGKDHISKVE